MNRREWLDMHPEDFDTDVDPATGEGLFVLPYDLAPPPDDGHGTGDLLAELGPVIHMTSTSGFHEGGYRVGCRCGWSDPVTWSSRHRARAAGDLHLAEANS